MTSPKKKMRKMNLTETHWGLRGKDGSFVWAGRFKPLKFRGDGYWYWTDCNGFKSNDPRDTMLMSIEGSMNAQLVRVLITEIKS